MCVVSLGPVAYISVPAGNEWHPLASEGAEEEEAENCWLALMRVRARARVLHFT